jgi:hypothetical protein
MTPAEFIFLILVHEAPVIATVPRLETLWRAELTAAVTLDAKVAEAALLVSPEVDAALLDAARWYEARLQSHPKDGDCHFVPIPGPKRDFKTVCSAAGVLQVQSPALRAVLGTVEGKAAGLPEEPITMDQMRASPELGVRAGYAGLARWKALCGGTTPARWLTAWGWGKCPPPRTVDREAVRRCELATILLAQRGQTPEGWKCGHEGRKIHDDRDARLLKWSWGAAKAAGKDDSR